MSEVKAKTTKRRILVDAYVRAEFHHGWFWHSKSTEEQVKELDRQCRDFKDFIRDHRCQDLTDLEVIRDYEDQCSACGNKWESTMDDGVETCAYCCAEVEQ